MTDLGDIWWVAKRRVTWPVYERMLGVGVKPRDMAAILRAGDVGIASIGVKDGRWREKEGGDEALVLPVYDADGDIADLVAFRLETPKAFWLHRDGPRIRGRAGYLGAWNLEEAVEAAISTRFVYEDCADEMLNSAANPDALVIHETPLDWLRDGCNGIVILDWQQPWEFELMHLPFIRTRDVAFARRLKAQLERPFKIPEIQVAA